MTLATLLEAIALSYSVATDRHGRAAPPASDAPTFEGLDPSAIRSGLTAADLGYLLGVASVCAQADDACVPVYRRVCTLVDANAGESEMAARLARRADRLAATREGALDPVQVCRAPPAWLRDQLMTFRDRFVELRTPLPQIELRGLTSIHYEHAEDRVALDALRAVPGFDKLLAWFIDYVVRRMEMELLLDSIEVTAGAMPELDRALAKACAVLDVEKPRLYVTDGKLPVKNAYTTGVDRPIIVLYERLVDSLTFDELVFVIGHELGHYKSGHVLYYNMAHQAARLASSALAGLLGIGDAAIRMLVLPALQYWARRSEFTADRAGLLACQDVSVAVTALAKLAGLPRVYSTDFEAEDLIAQAQRLDELYEADWPARAAVALGQLYDTHPRTVWRVKTLMQWVDAGEYEDLVRATPDERDYFRGRIDDDPTIVQFLDVAVESILEWSEPAGRTEGMLALREIRRMVRLGRHPTRGPLADIFSVRLELARRDWEYEAKVTLYLLKDGKPHAVVLPVAHKQPWSMLPADVRSALLRAGESSTTHEIYRRGSKT